MSLSANDIEDIARVVLRVIDEQRPVPVARSRAARLGIWVKDHPTIPYATAAAVLVLLVARLAYGVEFGTILSEVARDYKQAQERNDLVESHLALGQEFLKVENLRAARAEFDQALALDPTNPRAKGGLFIANIFEPIAKGEHDAEVASKRLEFLLAEDYENPILLMISGHVHLGNSDLKYAMDFYDLALEKDHDLAGAYSGKASVHSLRNDSAKSLPLHQKAIGLSPGNARYRHNYGSDLLQLGRYRDALKQFTMASLYDPQLIPTRLDLAETHRLLGEYTNAAAHYQTAIELLSNERTATLDLNSRIVTFQLEYSEPVKAGRPPKLVQVVDARQKRYLAHLQLALTLHLQAGESRARAQLKRARRLQLPLAQAQNINRVVVDQMALLERTRPGLARRLDAFRKLLTA